MSCDTGTPCRSPQPSSTFSVCMAVGPDRESRPDCGFARSESLENRKIVIDSRSWVPNGWSKVPTVDYVVLLPPTIRPTTSRGCLSIATIPGIRDGTMYRINGLLVAVEQAATGAAPRVTRKVVKVDGHCRGQHHRALVQRQGTSNPRVNIAQPGE